MAETYAEYMRLVTATWANVAKFSGLKSEFRAWHTALRMKGASLALGYLFRSASLPAMHVEDSDESESACGLEIKKYIGAMLFIRGQIVQALSDSLKSAVNHLPKYKIEVLFENVKGDETRVLHLKKIFTVLEIDDEEFADEFPHVYEIVNYVSKRMTAKTGAEKAALIDELDRLVIEGNKFDDFTVRVKDIVAELEECDVHIDNAQIQAVITRKLPAHARPVVAALMVNDPDLETVIDTISAHFRSEDAMIARDNKQNQSAKNTSESQVLTFAEQNDYAGGRGYARGYRGGRGGYAGGRGRGRGGAQRHFGRTCMCFNCGKYGHMAQYCKLTQPPHSRNLESEESESEPCSYCGRDGHSVEDCWTKLKEERKEKKVRLVHSHEAYSVLKMHLQTHTPCHLSPCVAHDEAERLRANEWNSDDPSEIYPSARVMKQDEDLSMRKMIEDDESLKTDESRMKKNGEKREWKKRLSREGGGLVDDYSPPTPIIPVAAPTAPAQTALSRPVVIPAVAALLASVPIPVQQEQLGRNEQASDHDLFTIMGQYYWNPKKAFMNRILLRVMMMRDVKRGARRRGEKRESLWARRRRKKRDRYFTRLCWRMNLRMLSRMFYPLLRLSSPHPQ